MASWDRGDEEPSKSYHYFTIYRDMGPTRALERVAKIVGVGRPALEVKSREWNWIARADQWDAHIAAVATRAQVEESEKAARQRMQAYTALLGKGLEALRGLDIEKATLAQASNAIDTAIKGMRLEADLVTNRIEYQVQDARALLAQLPEDSRRRVSALIESYATTGAAASGSSPHEERSSGSAEE
jgi:hypothetical protein